MSRNNVRGPTSALTEFLREAGITPVTVARAARRSRARLAAAPREDEEENNAVDEPSSSMQGRSGRTSGYASDQLDEPDTGPVSKKRKLSMAAQAKAKAKGKGKKKGNADDSNEDYTDDDDEYTALSKSRFGPSKPQNGSWEECAQCRQQFIVTRFTKAANPGPGFLCRKCSKLQVDLPSKKIATPRRRKMPKENRKVVSFEEKPLPSLASMCIEIISRHIDDVEALGDIGSLNMHNISKSISKNRGLTPENVQLFYGGHNSDLILYDVTNLTPQAFSTLAHLNPNLTHLRLDLCGRLDDTVMKIWCTSFRSLQRLELHGPFLVHAPAWKSFFASHPRLESFRITQSPRFDSECLEALAVNCRSLKELRLKGIGLMNEKFLQPLKDLPQGLRYLDLSEPGNSLSEQGLIELMSVFGPTLTHLDLSDHCLITDKFLNKGIKLHVTALASLTLRNIPELTDERVAEFFDSWSVAADDRPKSLPLVSLDLSRNVHLSSDTLSALLTHSGSALRDLNINGWRSTSEEALNEIPQRAKQLQTLDVGFCHNADDFFVKALLENCPKIEQIKCWGCSRVTRNCPMKRDVHIYGVTTFTGPSEPASKAPYGLDGDEDA